MCLESLHIVLRGAGCASLESELTLFSPLHYCSQGTAASQLMDFECVIQGCLGMLDLKLLSQTRVV